MKEQRNSNFDVKNIPESRTVEGYALVFNKESRDLGGFKETIDSSSLDGVIAKSDILCLLNHNEERGVLARSKFGNGSLELTIDDTGLRYKFDAPNTQLGDELLEGIRRGDISTSSFAFKVAEDKWEKRSDGSYLRRITKFEELYDVSPVYRPAYDATSVKIDTRKFEEVKQLDKELLETYYKELREGLN